jgi:16S rRNA (cytidine1402-2'-O)-methyltransferase
MLYVVATPIGNLDDLSPRALEALRKADIIACEDTRRTRALLSHFNVPRPAGMVSYREQTEQRAGQRLLKDLLAGRTVALCTDGGYPGVSDPGYRLLRLAADHDVAFEVIPGASAVTTALLLSALPTSSFTFKGYPPRKPGALRRFFEQERDAPHTLVLFESPFRVAATLQAALETLGDRQAAVCREMTKLHETVLRGFLSDLLETVRREPARGEVTLVVAGNHPRFRREPPGGAPDGP